MSFSSEVKGELARLDITKKCCMLAEIAGFLRVSSSIRLAGGGKFSILASTENAAIARHYKKLIEDYFASYSGVKEYISSIVEKAKANGYVQTIYGRRRYLPDINSRNAVVRAFSERNAVNAPLQGSAADIIKLAMINVFSQLVKAGLKSRMVLQVHDELIFDVAPGEEQAIMDIARSCMESVAVLKVPLTAECSAAENWLLAH